MQKYAYRQRAENIKMKLIICKTDMITDAFALHFAIFNLYIVNKLISSRVYCKQSLALFQTDS